MAQSQHAAYAVPGIGATAAYRLAVRLLAMTGMVLAAWILGAMLLTQPAAHGAEAPAAASSAGSEAASAESGTDSATGSADAKSADTPADAEPSADKPGGLLGGVVRTVTDGLRKPVDAITEPIRKVTAPVQNGKPKPELPVVGDLLPDKPAENPSQPVRILPLPTHPGSSTGDSMELLPLREAPVAAAGVSQPPSSAVPQRSAGAQQALAPSAGSQHRAGTPTAQLQRLLASPQARQALLGAASNLPLPFPPDQQPNREQSPASPAPPAPTAKINQAQGGNGNDREQFAVLPRSGGHNVTVGVVNEHNERVQRGAAAPGLPAVSPD